ncbi:MAG: caspase family protein [Bacteroidota bacterium]
MTDKKRGGFELNKTSKRKISEGTSWFFGIGINDYLEFPDLNNAVKDVTDIQKILHKKYKLEEAHSFLILDDEAIEENIIDRFDWLAKDVQLDDKLIIYYSGHGHLNKDTGLGYWIPHDAKKDKTSRYIRNSTIHEYIKVIKAKHILLISDSCFSGSLFARGGNRSTNTSLDELETFASRWAICSGRHDEEVYDGQPGGNSPFAEAILDTLLNNQKKALNVSKLSERIMEQTRANYQQLPEGSPLYGVGHKGGQYIFRMKADEKESWAVAHSLGTLEAYQNYVDNHPNGKNVEEAKTKITSFKDELAWEEAKRKNTITGYINYDEAFPEGKYSTEALEAIKILEEEKLWVTAKKKPTLYNYRNYIKTYPKGKYIAEAEKSMETMLSDASEESKNPNEPVKEYAKEDPDQKEKVVAREKEDSSKTPVITASKSAQKVVTPIQEKKSGLSPQLMNIFKFGAAGIGILCFVIVLIAIFSKDQLNLSDFTSAINGNEVTFRGKVSDQDGQNLSGVSISIIDADAGTFTDGNGEFFLTLPTPEHFYYLEFSHPGFETHTIDWNPNNEFDGSGGQTTNNSLPGENSTKQGNSADQDEEEAWANAVDDLSPAAFNAYSKNFPNGKRDDAAQFMVAWIENTLAQPNPCFSMAGDKGEFGSVLLKQSDISLDDLQLNCVIDDECYAVLYNASTRIGELRSRGSSVLNAPPGFQVYSRTCLGHTQ